MADIYISNYIYPIDRFGRIGKVHSLFSNSFNVVTANQLLHFSNSPNFISYYGLVLPKLKMDEIIQYAKIGDVVKFQPKRISFYTNHTILKIDLSNIQLMSLQLEKFLPDFKLIEQIVLALEKFNLFEKIGIEINEQLSDIFNLMHKHTEISNYAVEKIVDYLIGRGKGLTPSGDDILVAYIGILISFNSSVAEKFTAYLSKIEMSTTDISKAYIQGVSNGLASYPFICFMQSIKNQKKLGDILSKFQNILSIGHTSGSDMGVGILLALLFVLKFNT